MLSNLVLCLALLGQTVAVDTRVLIAQLGHDDFAVRHSATEQLTQLVITGKDPSLIATLEELVSTHKDPEVQLRARHIVRRQRLAFLKRYPSMPWIDSLPQEYPNRSDVIRVYLSAAQDIYPRSQGYPFPEYRLATFIFVRDLICNNVPQQDIEKLLNAMYLGDEQQRIAHNYPRGRR